MLLSILRCRYSLNVPRGSGRETSTYGEKWESRFRTTASILAWSHAKVELIGVERMISISGSKRSLQNLTFCSQRSLFQLQRYVVWKKRNQAKSTSNPPAFLQQRHPTASPLPCPRPQYSRSESRLPSTIRASRLSTASSLHTGPRVHTTSQRSRSVRTTGVEGKQQPHSRCVPRTHHHLSSTHTHIESGAHFATSCHAIDFNSSMPK